MFGGDRTGTIQAAACTLTSTSVGLGAGMGLGNRGALGPDDAFMNCLDGDGKWRRVAQGAAAGSSLSAR
jgi:hypothetical protein